MKALRSLPKIDKLVAYEVFEGLNKKLITALSRQYLQNLRERILAKEVFKIDEKTIVLDILQEYKKSIKSSLVPLINATGVILHTNLGRAVLSPEIFEQAMEISCGYSNLEFDLKNGKRGERYEHVANGLSTLLGVEDALIVNNNAAAVFLILNTFAKDKEVVLSRGELVEIGGSFRVPDVMRESGCKLKEVGTTNKTKIEDYENAINDQTAILMKVHQSNFFIKGFTQSVGFEEIVKLAKDKNVLDFYDVGGAYFEDFGLDDDSLDIKKILKCNPSLVSFSGDKLFGSVQSGIIVGKKKYIDKLKKNQLLRMLRVDKVTLSLLDASVKSYLEGKLENIPTLTLLKRDNEELEALCEEALKGVNSENCKIIHSTSFVGGGTMPEKSIPSVCISIKGDALKLQKLFRQNGVIGRVEKDEFLLDFRSVLNLHVKKINEVLKKVL